MELGKHPARRRGNPLQPHSALHVLPVPDHYARRGEAGDAHLDSAPLQDDVRPVHEGVAGKAADVGTDVRERGTVQCPGECGESPVELVIAQRPGIVADQVHGPDNRVGVLWRDAGKVGSEGIALDQVTRIQQEDLPGIGTPQRIHHGGHSRESARETPVSGVIPGEGTAVHVRGRNDDEASGVGRRGPRSGQHCRRQQE